MNAPLTPPFRALLKDATLDDKYTLERGRAFMTGTQALIRLMMLQRERDRHAGLNTAGFISGYRGSPLTNVDLAAAKAKKYLDASQIRFHGGLNEDLAATSIWGTQQVGLFPGATVDGVFGLWYGKGPGVDRCGDVFKHANMAGTSRHGGVLVCAGDDHAAKSSTVAHQSEHILKACGIPVLYPSSIQEYLDYGLYGFALSRYSGLWVALKCVTDIVESAATVEIDPDRVQIALPDDFELPPDGLNIRDPDGVLAQDARMSQYKWYAALAFIRANRLNKIVWDSPRAKIGIIAAGKSYLDTRQALSDLGIDEQAAVEIGIRLYKVAMNWPLEAQGVHEFARGLEEILVVEEKRQILEYQLKEELYNLKDAERPRVVGKFDDTGEWSNPHREGHGSWLLLATYEHNPAQIARAIASRVACYFAGHSVAARVQARLAFLQMKEEVLRELPAKPDPERDRVPHFCSGCPHNTSTKLPEGSRALAGIGCHNMVTWMGRRTSTFTHMGGEGVPWIGQAPFTTERHLFANLGDGTYFHSGILAIRAAISANVNITYKLLYNDAVAMTGGQHVDGQLDPFMLAEQVAAEGIQKLVVVTDDPGKYPANRAWPPGTTIRHRDELDAVQRELRAVPGVTVLLYDQTCAAEKRRRRKIGTYPDPAMRVVINAAVCEGCGDCGVQSNCLSVEPLETPFGRKRRINQSSCNKDFSCLRGFCPSFVTVEGGSLKKPDAVLRAALAEKIPLLHPPELPQLSGPFNVLVTGIGGTGVLTVGQILAVAAHLEGLSCTVLDVSGLAQKGGAVLSHVRIAARQDELHATKLGTGAADVVIGGDLLVTASVDALSKMGEGATHAVVNTACTPTAGFVRDADWVFPQTEARRHIESACGADRVLVLDATMFATRLFGDSMASNLFLLGFVWQKGWLPVSEAAVQQAVRLNGVSVEMNLEAFAWGRRAAIDCVTLECALNDAPTVKLCTLDEQIAFFANELVSYQNEAYARQYRDFVARVRMAEAALGSETLTGAVAHNLYKLMAYKDEYEVARLHSDGRLQAQIKERFEGDVRLKFHLAPPLWAGHDSEGHLKKKTYGPWMGHAMRWLAKGKFLRGRWCDPFGHTAERQSERALIGEYRALIESLLPRLNAGNMAVGVTLAGLPAQIRGFGHVKEKAIAQVRVVQEKALAEFAAK